jgi:transcription factor SPN1
MSSPSESRPGSPLQEAGHDSSHDNEDLASAPGATPAADIDNDLSDNDSILSDVDEAQFEDFDPANVAIDRPAIVVDEGTVKLLGRHKRKRDGEGADEEGGKKKKKDGKRSKKSGKRNDDDDDDFSGGQEVEGKRIRKKKPGAEGARRDKARARKTTPEDEESLDPEESKLHLLL